MYDHSLSTTYFDIGENYTIYSDNGGAIDGAISQDNFILSSLQATNQTFLEANYYFIDNYFDVNIFHTYFERFFSLI